MSTPETVDDILAMPVAKARTLSTNAWKSNDPKADALRNLFKHPSVVAFLSEGGLPLDHPIMAELYETCTSPAARAAALSASEAGLPALAGVEPIILNAGIFYDTDFLRQSAGGFLAEVMADAGWLKAGVKPMPEGSVAKSAATYKRRA